MIFSDTEVELNGKKQQFLINEFVELDRPIPKQNKKEFDFWKKQTITKLKNKENFRLDLIRLIKRIKYIKNKKSFSSIDKRYLPPNEKQTSIVLKNLKAIKKNSRVRKI